MVEIIDFFFFFSFVRETVIRGKYVAVVFDELMEIVSWNIGIITSKRVLDGAAIFPQTSPLFL